LLETTPNLTFILGPLLLNIDADDFATVAHHLVDEMRDQCHKTF
jgi:hypothetical protein